MKKITISYDPVYGEPSALILRHPTAGIRTIPVKEEKRKEVKKDG